VSGLDRTNSRELRLVTGTGAIATGLFLVVAGLTTQVASVRAALPFTEDPYDGVVSFAVVAIAVVGGASIVRAMATLRRPPDPVVARRIAIGAVIATLFVAVALVSDVAALLVGPTDLAVSGVGIVLGLLAITGASTVIALICIGRARLALRRNVGSAGTEPDMLDALGSIVESVGAAQVAAGFAGWFERSPLSPRRHRVLTGLLGGLAAGVAAVAWHAVREGPWGSPGVAALFGGLMAVGVAGVYLLCLGPLRLLRPATRDYGRSKR